MTKLQHNGRQHTITLPEDSIRRMGWKKGTELYIAKDPDRNLLYIEEMPNGKQK